MPVSVKYNGRLIGNGQLLFPETFTERITDDMPELIHEDSCKFEKNGEVMGTIKFMCRLLIKCADKPKTGQAECRQNLGTCIVPRDILFLISESQRCPDRCDPCLDAWEPEAGDERLNLDLLRYQSFDAKKLSTAATLKHHPACDAITCELKQMAKECEETMDVILRGTGCQKPKPCRTADALRGPCEGPCHSGEQQTPPLGVPARAPSLPANLGQDRSKVFRPQMKMSVGDHNKPDIKPSRFCPVCLANMSWLPRFAACPKCGLKPMPVVEEIQKQNRLKAEQIILDYLGKPQATVEDYCELPCEKKEKKEKNEDKGQLAECRCSCRYGKICASCRVRAQCAEYIDNKEQLRRPRAAGPEEEEEAESEDFCVVDEKPKESRPFLSRVFSELRDIYDIKDTVRPGPGKVSEQPRKKQPKKEKKTSCTVKRETEPKNRVRVEHMALKTQRLISPLHKMCARKQRGVSRRHGWAWNATLEARKYGWRPGAILKPMKRVMKHFLEYTPEKTPLAMCNRLKDQAEEQERQRPMLNLRKRNGEIFVTLRANNTDSVQMQPIVFKIVKSELAVIVSEIKRKLKAKGFRKCSCHQTLMMCNCRDNEEKKLLESAVEKESRRHGVENCVDHLVLTDTSESELEYDLDVSPEAGQAVRQPAGSPRMNHSTQTMPGKKHLLVAPKYPVRQDFYKRSYDCAAGDRYTGTALGQAAELVTEDGLFGYRRGGPHGEFTHPGGRLKSQLIWGSQPGGPMHGGGRFGRETTPGGKSFPGAKKKRKSGQNKPIPVRMPKRFYKAAEEAAKAAKAAAEHAKKKKPTDMMQYMMKKGAVSIPWNPRAKAY
ncbi:hypothetical protein ACLKA7_005337 [Drosophila subpalustris]